MPDQTLRQPPANPIDSALQHGQFQVRQPARQTPRTHQPEAAPKAADGGGGARQREANIADPLAAAPQGAAAAGGGARQREANIASTRYPTTKKLPLDAQKKMTSAVKFAAQFGAPIQTMLTINAAHLQMVGSDGVLAVGNLWDIHRDFLELLRKWVTSRDLPWVCIWVREFTGGRNRHPGEHWHIILHLPSQHWAALPAQIAVWTGEGVGAHDDKKKCIARSETGAWYLSKSDGNAGEYLGKATPKTRRKYGRLVPNPLRKSSQHFGGEGPIEGKRFGISRHIGKTAQDEYGRMG